MVRNTLLLVAAFLAQATVLVHAFADPKPLAAPRESYPCPEPEDILPCVCTKDEQAEHIDMDCSNVQSSQQLRDAFHATIPFPTFRNLIIEKKTNETPIPITNIDKDTFNNIQFSYIRISHTTLQDIAPDTFEYSHDILETLIVTDSNLDSFPFDILIDCPKLTDLRVFRNKIFHMSDIRSTSLLYLQVSHNPGITYGDEAFFQAPNLQYLLLNDIKLAHVAPDTFSKQSKLKYLDLSHNGITTLYAGSLAFYGTVDQIKLNNNRIQKVQVNAFSGLKPGSVLWMHHNLLDDLPADVWKPVFETVNNAHSTNLFVFDDNPLTCQCNILWLVENANYMDTMAAGAWCSDKEELLVDVDVAFLQNNCPPSETV
ncbi:oplophorus-luciferin 2-monooxygenase non-catalytic subunit-like [Homarus americanus]|uniref:Oplophorus-luciferin 2-monooxygenase non-catalytic subunit-like 14 n=1 Tax=Homarus americanus TaxID=6706 RepID=A0A8J5JT85_HOMAM|nr:oplophorus-luciferin 2-monooxygenase non-catalytic subunit-like [Homarus americanus]KAG7162026.1 Oplophorus-luciferin 2-monooxygenase non-catalytic subunit-like 14 [Homarus americanus]